jgi:hypothetical protein
MSGGAGFPKVPSCLPHVSAREALSKRKALSAHVCALGHSKVSIEIRSLPPTLKSSKRHPERTCSVQKSQVVHAMLGVSFWFLKMTEEQLHVLLPLFSFQQTAAAPLNVCESVERRIYAFRLYK